MSRLFFILRAWWIVDLHQRLSVTADVCGIHSAQGNFPRGDTGALSHSASVSTVLLDWERHKYLMSPPASTALKMQRRVRHKLCSGLRTGLLWTGCDQWCQKQNTRAKLEICANTFIRKKLKRQKNSSVGSAARQGQKNKKQKVHEVETFCTLHIHPYIHTHTYIVDGPTTVYIDIHRYVRPSNFLFVVQLGSKGTLVHEATGLRLCMIACAMKYKPQYPWP